MILKRGFSIFVASLCLMDSGSAVANDLLEHYRLELADNPTGVYESIGHVYFITEAGCIEDKRSAGSTESKRAEKKFFQVFTQEVQNRSVSIETSEWSSFPIFAKVEQQLVAEKFNQIKVGYQLLSDSNLEGCVRRQVRVSQLESFVEQTVVVSQQEVAKRVAMIIAEWVATQDYEQLTTQLDFEALSEVSALYKTLNQEAALTADSESQNIEGLDHYDINAVLGVAKSQQGMRLATSHAVNLSSSQYWYSQADTLFKEGLSPDQIQQYLTLSLNANPMNTEGWKILSNLMRSVSPDDALWTARQQFLTSGGSLDVWVYLYKALEVNHPQQANQLHKFLQHVAPHWSLSDWEQNQIKG